MTPEILSYVRRGLRQGTWPLIQRYIVAGMILDMAPVEVAKESDFTVHIRVCDHDAVMLHWAVRSLLLHSSVPWQLTIHDDGTCRPATLAVFKRSFVNCRVYTRAESLAIVATKLAAFDDLRRWHRSTFTGIKWIDYYLLGNSKFVVFLDSDVLFFRDPVEVFRGRGEAVWMKDCFYSQYFERDEAARWYGVNDLPQLNSGLARVPREWFDAALATDVLKRVTSPEIVRRAAARGLPVNDDQTFNAVVSAAKGSWQYLSDDYCLAMEPGIGRSIARHYVGSRRFGFYEEGIPRVARQLDMKLPLWLRERA